MRNIVVLLCLMLTVLGCGNKAIEDGFKRNDVHTISAGWVSSFAIPVSDDQVILVDTGGEEDAASVLLGLEALGYAPEDVSHIFITHGHKDHVAGHQFFEDALLVGFAEDEALIEEKLDKSVVMDIPLIDGEITNIEGIEIEAFHLPGHTEGNATYLINKIMLMGDTAMGNDDGTLSEPPGFFSADEEAVKNQIKGLWSRLEDRQDDVEWLFFAHTGAHEGLESLKTYSE